MNSPHVREHYEAGDEHDDAEHRTRCQDKSLLQGHEPARQASTDAHCLNAHPETTHAQTHNIKQHPLNTSNTPYMHETYNIQSDILTLLSASSPGRGKKEKIFKGVTQSLANDSSTPMTSTKILSDTPGLQNNMRHIWKIQRNSHPSCDAVSMTEFTVQFQLQLHLYYALLRKKRWRNESIAGSVWSGW